MMKRLTLAVCLLAGPAFSQDASSVVATVNGQEITLGQMLAMKKQLNEQATGTLQDEALYDLMLDQLIRQAAVAEVGESQMDAGDQAMLENDRRAYFASAALERVAETEPSDEEITAAYKKAFEAETAPLQYSAAHILLETEESAKEVKKLLDEGGDFSTLAEERSTDSSGPNKGELGWFSADQMVKPFADAVAALKKGEISDPVQSDFGWHVIRLNDTRQVKVPEIEEIRPQLVQQVRREKVEAEIQRLVEEADIKRMEGFDPVLLQKVDLLNADARPAQ